MDDMATHIDAAIETSGKKPKQIAEAMGLTESAVSQWRTGKTKPALKTLVGLADVLGVTLDALILGRADTPGVVYDPKRHAPVLNKVQAGGWGNVVTPFSDWALYQMVELYHKPRGFALALEVDGMSMAPDYLPRDIIVVDTGEEPQPGSLVVAVLDGEEEATFKRYRLRGHSQNNQPIIDLVPLNPDYPTLTISPDRPGRIIGTVVQHTRFPGRR